MTVIAQNPLTDLDALVIRTAGTEAGEGIVTWQGRQALRLENGLALLPNIETANAHVEVWIGSEGPAYPGIAFRVADVLNYELAYAVPHVSGQWDALQYDPVFHGSNTWQLYHGPAYQRAAEVPTGRWFRLAMDVCAVRATVAVDGQPPLVVERLARGTAAGLLGLWTFRTAYFCDLIVSSADGLEIPPGAAPHAPEGTVDAWFVEGYGIVDCEPHGVLNLNRYLPASVGEVRLTRRFRMPASGEAAFEFGFSDALLLELDGQAIFQGENTFHGFADRAARGYAEPGMHALVQTLSLGTHRLAATLKVSEGFGWGLVLAVQGEDLHWLPAELG
jgi:hypothetical protein